MIESPDSSQFPSQSNIPRVKFIISRTKKRSEMFGVIYQRVCLLNSDRIKLPFISDRNSNASSPPSVSDGLYDANAGHEQRGDTCDISALILIAIDRKSLIKLLRTRHEYAELSNLS